jgi:hypothetical protein
VKVYAMAVLSVYEMVARSVVWTVDGRAEHWADLKAAEPAVQWVVGRAAEWVVLKEHAWAASSVAVTAGWSVVEKVLERADLSADAKVCWRVELSALESVVPRAVSRAFSTAVPKVVVSVLNWVGGKAALMADLTDDERVCQKVVYWEA